MSGVAQSIRASTRCCNRHTFPIDKLTPTCQIADMQYEDFARTPEADLLTRICLSVLQINGQLQGVGDRLGSDLGLPSSRFQVLGPISLSDTGLTVPQIARR